MKKITTLLGALAIACGCAPIASAAIQITFSIDHGTVQACGTAQPDSGTAECSGAVGDVSVLLLASHDNSPGTPALAQLFTSALQLTSGSNHTIDVWISGQDFTQPTAPPEEIYEDALQLTQTTGSAAVSDTACIDEANGLPPQPGVSGVNPTFCTNPAVTIHNAAPTLASGTPTTVSSLTTPYALEDHITIVITGGSNINIIESQSLSPTVPEPATVVLLGTVLVGVSSLFRKKRDKRAEQ